MAVVILAGGLSTRMGRDKASLPLAGSTLLGSLVSRFRGRLGEVIVVLRPGQEIEVREARTAYDVYEGLGPVGGLHAGLSASPDDENFVLACDMPLADPSLAGYLLSLLADHNAVVPLLARGPEPLHAAYRKSCLSQIEENLGAGKLRLTDLLDRVDTLYVPEADIRQLDPELRSFLNVNTPKDYAQIRRLV